MSELERLEELRKKIIKKTAIGVIIAILVGMGLFYITRGQFLGVIIFAVVIGTIVTALLTGKDQKEFNEIYKRIVVLSSFQKMFTDIEYKPTNGIAYETIASTQMMNMGDRYHSNDYIKAKYKNINFESADVHIEEEHTDDEGHTTYVTIFRGQWFIFDFNKPFKANIQVCAKNFHNAKRGSLFSKTKYNKVSMEDMEFNKEFKVYAQNELDAFYVLTPNCMEKIKELKDKTKGRLLLCFIDNRLHVGLYNNKDLFEANIFKKINLEEEQNKTLNEMKIITEFVDTLDLDNDLFRREV